MTLFGLHTLHTGMLYTTGGAESFCSLSDSKRHDAPSIWAHLMPILDWIQESCPLVKHLYFLSDGPTTQYRNKTNMYLMSTIPADRGFISVNWIFTEAGHGKGAPDGVGAAVKRRADAIVSSGKDITNCADLMQNLSNQESKTRLLTVNAIDIEAVDKMLGPNIPIIKGIMKIHQVICITRGVIEHRELSCLCMKPAGCQCMPLTKVTLSHETTNTGNILSSGFQWCYCHFVEIVIYNLYLYTVFDVCVIKCIDILHVM